MSRRAALTALLLLLLLLLRSAAFAEEGITDAEHVEGARYRCVYGGAEREFLLYLPEDFEGSPLVLMLHGYGGSVEGFRTETRFEQDANARGYSVAYVAGAPDPGDKTSAVGWDHAGPGRDTGFLCALASYLAAAYRLDESRVFAVGFSNGAFMAHRLALEAGDVFAAVVSVAGSVSESVWERRPAACRVGLLQITGEKDQAVPKHSDGSARYARSPAVEDLIAWYAEANGLAGSETEALGNGSVLTKYTGGSDRQVWHALISGGRHSWSAERITGVNTNELILSFLDTQ